VLINPTIRGTHRERIITVARAGADLDPDQAHLARVIEYDVPDREGNGAGELIVLLTTIVDPAQARADEFAAAYHDCWEEETANDQLKTHLRGPGRIPRSRARQVALINARICRCECANDAYISVAVGSHAAKRLAAAAITPTTPITKIALGRDALRALGCAERPGTRCQQAGAQRQAGTVRPMV
jgi:hypothetical protein